VRDGRDGLRGKDLDVGRFMERPRTRYSETVAVDTPNRFTEREHTINQVQMKSQDFIRACVGPMMCVMKEDSVPVLALLRQDLVGHHRLRPLMDQNNVRTL